MEEEYAASGRKKLTGTERHVGDVDWNRASRCAVQARCRRTSPGWPRGHRVTLGRGETRADVVPNGGGPGGRCEDEGQTGEEHAERARDLPSQREHSASLRCG